MLPSEVGCALHCPRRRALPASHSLLPAAHSLPPASHSLLPAYCLHPTAPVLGDVSETDKRARAGRRGRAAQFRQQGAPAGRGLPLQVDVAAVVGHELKGAARPMHMHTSTNSSRAQLDLCNTDIQLKGAARCICMHVSLRQRGANTRHTPYPRGMHIRTEMHCLWIHEPRGVCTEMRYTYTHTCIRSLVMGRARAARPSSPPLRRKDPRR